MANILNSTERSLRSVFVGNIPYDATEEKLKDIFSEVGPVLSFRLVYDRETGKPKGYGFCEYKDQDTAHSAMRNLNAYELNGRSLRVDNAANERIREEMRNLQLSLGGTFESPYGPEIDPEKAPEAISKAVASLPPEQMFELAKQMKQCIQTNPNEARNMLIQNPQLAYALLQALVVMRVVDPQVAMSILHRPNPNITPLMPAHEPLQQPMIPPSGGGPSQPMFDHREPYGQSRNAPLLGAAPQQMMQQPFDNRMHDPRFRDNAPPDRVVFDRYGPPTGPPQMSAPPMPQQSAPNIDPRTRQPPIDPRLSQQLAQHAMRGPMNSAAGRSGAGTAPPLQIPSNIGNMSQSGNLANQEQEKAQLIMQVLALSDQQIAMLPPEQRQSILLLKEQISRNQ